MTNQKSVNTRFVHKKGSGVGKNAAKGGGELKSVDQMARARKIKAKREAHVAKRHKQRGKGKAGKRR